MLHAHEIAYHWFGNLITPLWWDDLWLNESFPTFMEAKFSNMLEPDWRFDVDIIKNSHQAMLLDRAKSVHSVHQEVSSTDGISAAFDDITYQKGAVILAMLENSLGEKEFQSFVQELLVTQAFGSITSDNFTKSLQLRKNGSAIAKIFPSYIENSGLPMVRITKQNSTVQLSQSLCQMDGFENEFLDQKIWYIPVCMSSLDNQNQDCQILSSHSKLLENSLLATAPSVTVDDVPRYYVFNVDRHDWLNILDAVPKMPKARALAVAISYDIAFLQDQVSLKDYLSGIEQIASHPDWEVAGFPIERLDFILSGTPPSSPFFESIRNKAVKIYHIKLTAIGLKKSFAGKNIHSSLLEIERADLVDLFVANNLDSNVENHLADLGEKISQSGNVPLDDNDLVPHDVVEAALMAAAKRDGERFLHQTLTKLGHSSDAYEREIWLRAIAASTAPSAGIEIERLLLSDILRNQEVPVLLFARAAIPEFRDQIWDVVDRHPKALLARLDGDFDITLIQIADGFVTEPQARRVKKTIAPLLGQLRGGAIQLKQTLEHIRSHEFFLRRLTKQFAG